MIRLPDPNHIQMLEWRLRDARKELRGKKDPVERMMLESEIEGLEVQIQFLKDQGKFPPPRR